MVIAISFCLWTTSMSCCLFKVHIRVDALIATTEVHHVGSRHLPHGRRAARCLRDLTVPKINCTSTRFSRKRVFETWYNDCDARENVSSHTEWIQGPSEVGQEKLITHTKELRTTNSAQRWDDSIYIESMTPYHSTPTVPHTLEEREEKTHCG